MTTMPPRSIVAAMRGYLGGSVGRQQSVQISTREGVLARYAAELSAGFGGRKLEHEGTEMQGDDVQRPRIHESRGPGGGQDVPGLPGHSPSRSSVLFSLRIASPEE